MSYLLKHALVQGINDRLVHGNHLEWPNEKVAFEVCAAIANDLTGPEMLSGPLDKESCLLIASTLKQASEEIARRGYMPDATSRHLAKQASQMDFGQRAAMIAEACMAKAASDASLTHNGTNTPEEAARNEQVARLDLRNRSTDKYNLGFGRTAMAEAGVVGRQQWAEGPQRVANSLSALDKQADEGASPGHLQRLLAAVKAVPGRAQMLGQDVAQGLRAMPGEASDLAELVARKMRHGTDASWGDIARSAAPLADKVGIGLGALGATAGLGYGAYRLAGGGEEKDASEDMSAGDLDMSGAAERGQLFLHALHNQVPGLPASAANLQAAAGLGAAGAEGLEVMAAVIDTVKTASDADAAIQQILHHQGEVGELASPELVAALQQLLAQEEGEEMPKVADIADIGHAAQMLRPSVFKDVADTIGEAAARRTRMEHGKAALKTIGKGVAGAGAVAGVGAGLHHLLSDKKKEAALSDIGHAAQMLRPSVFKDVADTIGEAAARRTRMEHGKAALKTIGKGVAGAGAVAGVGAGLHHLLSDKKKEKKSSELLEYIKRAAEGSLTNVGPNTPGAAAKVDQVARLDLQNRGEDEHNIGPGKTKLPSPGQGYAQKAAPKAEETTVSNSLSAKSASEREYEAAFRKTAEEYAGQLPASLSREEKIAAIQYLLGLPPSSREGYIVSLYQ